MSNSNSKPTLEERNNLALMHFLAEGGDIEDYIPLTDTVELVTKGNLVDLFTDKVPTTLYPPITPANMPVELRGCNLSFLQNNVELAPIIAAPIPTVNPQLKMAEVMPILSENSPDGFLPFALKDVPYESLPSLCGHILENRDAIPKISYYNSANDEQGILCDNFLKFWDSLEETVNNHTYKPFVGERFEITFLTFCQFIHKAEEGTSVYDIYNHLKVLPVKWEARDSLDDELKGSKTKKRKTEVVKPKINSMVKELRQERDLKMADLNARVKQAHALFMSLCEERIAYKKEMQVKIENAKKAEAEE